MLEVSKSNYYFNETQFSYVEKSLFLEEDSDATKLADEGIFDN